MRRSTTIRLAVMGGGLMTIGAVSALHRHNTDQACVAAPNSNAGAPCAQGSSGGSGGGGGSYGHSGGGGTATSSEASGSARGGFGASAAGHAGG